MFNIVVKGYPIGFDRDQSRSTNISVTTLGAQKNQEMTVTGHSLNAIDHKRVVLMAAKKY